MPQFLRGIRILSALYPTYIRAIKHSSSPITTSTPSLTTIPSTQGEVPDRASWSSYVHRVGSNGSVTKGQLPRTSTVSSNASKGHHRSCSQTVMSPDKRCSRKGGREEVMEREENTEMRKHAVGAKVVQMRNQTLGLYTSEAPCRLW